MKNAPSYSLKARWTGRIEGREAVAARISVFLEAAGAADDVLGTWLVGLGLSGAFQRADTSVAGIVGLLNQPGATPLPQVDFGAPTRDAEFSLILSNGLNASFLARVGAPGHGSSILLSFNTGEEPRDPATWRKLMSAAVAAFDPDSATVTSHQRHGNRQERAAGLETWFTYRRGEQIAEGPIQ